MLITIMAILLALWAIGLIAEVGGAFVHLLLLAAGFVFIANMMGSRRLV